MLARERGSTFHWSSIRGAGSSQASQGNSNARKRRRLESILVVVEGINDMRAVKRAIDVDVFVLGSATKAADSEALDTLRAMKKKYLRIVLLLDPDVAGRQARNEIESKISGCWHAFVPTMNATAKEDKKYKEEGDVGVEHAKAESIVRAIFRSRQLANSNLYSRDGLISVGLIAPMHSRPGDVTIRRQLFCSYLGLGMCDGKQLLKQLNSYGFSQKECNEALEYANFVLQNKSNNLHK